MKKNIKFFKEYLFEIFLSIISGILLSISFPKFEIFPLAWIALAPLFAVLLSSKPGKGFLMAFISGAAFFLPAIFWFSLFGYAPWIVGSLYSALFWGLFGLVFCWFSCKFNKKDSLLILFFSPMLWVFFEYLRSVGPFGFTWGYLSYSQYKFLPLIQISSVAGAWGISFLIVLVNTLLAQFSKNFSAKENRSFFRLFSENFRRLQVNFAVVMLILGICLVWGERHLRSPISYSNGIKAGIVQVNIDQEIKWQETFLLPTMDILESMTLDAVKRGCKIIIWPETAVPEYLEFNSSIRSRVAALAGENNIYILAGAIHYKDGEKYNAVFLIDPAGRIEGMYLKVHLVPFGEYLPLYKHLRRFHIFDRVQDFSSGRDYVIFKSYKGDFASMICFESIFPSLSRMNVLKGAGFLTVLTNDAWFYRTSAAYHHFAMGVIRAVENGEYLVQSANTGISGIIDPRGRIIEKTSLYERVVVEGYVYPQHNHTIYTEYGDYFVFICIAGIVFLGIIRTIRPL